MRMKRTLLLDRVGAQGWVVDQQSLEIKVFRVFLVQEMVTDIRDIIARIRFTGDIDLLAVQVKGIHEVLEEASKLRCDIILVDCGRLSLGEASPNRPIIVESQ